MHHRFKIPFTLPLILSVLLSVTFFSGCGSDKTGDPTDNLPPSIEITGGPIQGGKDSYTTRIWWTGWDEDGIIDHYEYAIDPPEAFSFEEVNSPEKFVEDGAFRLTVIRGPEEGTDTLTYAKTLDGVDYEFRYVQTRDFVRSFAFSTPDPDSLPGAGGRRIPAPTFSGFHTIYVRAQDNEDSYSNAKTLSFTAETFVPQSEITRPQLGPSELTVGTQIRIEWDGTDVDSPDPQRKPVGYLYKLVNLDNLDPPINPLSVTDPGFVVYRAGSHIPWVAQSAETTSVSFFLENRGNYVFAVRAVDIAGAVEANIVKLRGDDPGNAVVLQAFSSSGFPELTITEPTLGQSGPHRGSGFQEWEVPVGQRLNFNWNADLEDYGGVLDGYNWGVDIPDISKDGPNSGWTGWTTATRNNPAIQFNSPGFHSVSIKVRDSAGTETVVTLSLKIIEFAFDREILVVDDFLDKGFPRDSERDAFWMKMLEESGRFTAEQLVPEDVMYHSFGPNDQFSVRPSIPKLEQFGRYELVVYDCLASGQGSLSGLLEASAKSRRLGSYLASGGKLWITGAETNAAMRANPNTGIADVFYPKCLTNVDFAYQFLKLYSCEIAVDRGRGSDPTVNGLYGVTPFPGRAEIFPEMTIDSSKQIGVLANKSGVGGTDFIKDPIFEQSEPTHTGTIDSLYAFMPFGPQLPEPKRSNFDGDLVGTRWHDPNPNRRQGRVIWFGFDVYYFHDDLFQETFNRAIDWFREEVRGQ